MKLISSLVLIALALVVVPTVSGQQQSEYLSLRLEMERAIRTVSYTHLTLPTKRIV